MISKEIKEIYDRDYIGLYWCDEFGNTTYYNYNSDCEKLFICCHKNSIMKGFNRGELRRDKHVKYFSNMIYVKGNIITKTKNFKYEFMNV